MTRDPGIIVGSSVRLTRSKTTFPPLNQTDLTEDGFYVKASASKDKQQAICSSATLKDEIPPSPRSSVGGAEWTVANPEWKQIWKESIVYPLNGRDKATINSEDIERLDEGQFQIMYPVG